MVALLDVGQATVRGRTIPYMDFEFVPGGDLKDWIDAGGKVTDDEAVDLATGLLRGVAALHAAQVVHRDIKPANIGLRNGDPRFPVVLDLGLAKLLDLDSISRQGTTVGTAMYMSPEQFRGDRRGKGMDVWAVGVVLHEVLSGGHPFFGEGERLTPTELPAAPGQPAPATPHRTPRAAAARDPLPSAGAVPAGERSKGTEPLRKGGQRVTEPAQADEPDEFDEVEEPDDESTIEMGPDSLGGSSRVRSRDEALDGGLPLLLLHREARYYKSLTDLVDQMHRTSAASLGLGMVVNLPPGEAARRRDLAEQSVRGLGPHRRP